MRALDEARGAYEAVMERLPAERRDAALRVAEVAARIAQAEALTQIADSLLHLETCIKDVQHLGITSGLIRVQS